MIYNSFISNRNAHKSCKLASSKVTHRPDIYASSRFLVLGVGPPDGEEHDGAQRLLGAPPLLLLRLPPRRRRGAGPAGVHRPGRPAAPRHRRRLRLVLDGPAGALPHRLRRPRAHPTHVPQAHRFALCSLLLSWLALGIGLTWSAARRRGSFL